MTIPSEVNGRKVTVINGNAFYNCDNITSVTIPDGVTEIGSKAFSGCSGLKSIELPDSATNIGDVAFHIE